LNRRQLLGASAALPLLTILPRSLAAAPGPTAFDASVVRSLARDAAAKPYKAPDNKLPDSLKDLNYDQYRALRFNPEKALWHGEKLPFEVQFFHRGSFYTNRVDIYEVANGQATQIPYQAENFSFGTTPPPPPGTDLGFGGFRLHAPINQPD
jgi:glucans biosynthesis protein